MALGAEIINLVRLCFLDQANEAGRIGKVAVMQEEPHVLLMPITVEVIDPAGIERGGRPLDTVDHIAFFQ